MVLSTAFNSFTRLDKLSASVYNRPILQMGLISMKKIAALLLAVLLFLNCCALALNGSGYPAWDGAALPENGLNAYFGEDMLSLEFDPAGEYSYIQDGLLTACFFAFDAGEQNYLEMYLMLPEEVSAGDVFSSADMRGDSSISLYEVSRNDECLYFAGQLAGMAYPGGSDYEIRIESAVQENGSLRISGRLHAALVRIEGSFITDETLTLKDCAFQFEMPVQGAKLPQQSFAPASTPEPFSAPSQPPLPESTIPPKKPAYTMDPHPAFTLPPDYRVI